MAKGNNVPVDQAGVWDVLTWDTVYALAQRVDSDQHGPVLAHRLVEAAARSDEDAFDELRKIARVYIGQTAPAERIRNASLLARLLGVKPEDESRFRKFLRVRYSLLGGG